MRARSRGPGLLPAASVLLVALVLLATVAPLEKRAFWVIDNANKFLPMQDPELRFYGIDLVRVDLR